ncbi:MAG TPA: hypothetical protein PKB06_08405, partial [Actinotalea sp.]|nr:hypothetical protein [Actinotalea sp.]
MRQAGAAHDEGASMTMTGQVSPPAVRLRRPGWRDPRLLAGVVLVAMAVALGTWAVGAAGRAVPVLATQHALGPGELVDRAALVVREVRLDRAEDLYLTDRADLLTEPLVVVRTVGAGELVPLGALAPATSLELRTVAVTPRGQVSADVVRGAAVDLWFVPAVRAGQGGSATPRQLAEGLTVAQVSD